MQKSGFSGSGFPGQENVPVRIPHKVKSKVYFWIVYQFEMFFFELNHTFISYELCSQK